MNEPAKAKRGWSLGVWIVVAVVTVLMILFYYSCRGCVIPVKQHPAQAQATGQAREIIALMHLYAADHGGVYPDHGLDPAKATSNEVFKQLFIENYTDNEKLFGCRMSRFMPDTNLGKDSNFDQTLTRSENHWALTAGLTKSSPPLMPLLWENAVDASWPLKWVRSSSFAKGRAWPGAVILVGLNDGSVLNQKLVSKEDFLHLPESFLNPKGRPSLPQLKILDLPKSGDPRDAFPPGLGLNRDCEEDLD